MSVPLKTRILLADAQTSGGMLISVPSEKADALIRTLEKSDAPAAARIGEIVAGKAGHITVSR